MRTLKDFRTKIQDSSIYLNNKEELKFFISEYIKTYCNEQKLPQISIRFAEIGNKGGICAAEENLIVVGEYLFKLFEMERNLEPDKRVANFYFLDTIEHELDHFKQYLDFYTDKEKISYTRPLTFDGYFLTEHEKKTYERTFDILEKIAKENNNDNLKQFTISRRISVNDNSKSQETNLKINYPEMDVDNTVLDMQEDIKFATHLYKKKELHEIGLNSIGTTNINYTTRIDNNEFNFDFYETRKYLVGTIKQTVGINEHSIVEFGIKEGTLHIFDVYSEENGIFNFENVLSEKGKLFFKENELYKMLNSVAKEYENKTGSKIINICFNKYMLTYDKRLCDKAVKEIKSLKNIHDKRIELLEDNKYYEPFYNLNAQKYFENLVSLIKNNKSSEIRNVILPEEIDKNEFNYYSKIFFKKTFSSDEIEDFFFKVLNDKNLDRNITIKGIIDCFNTDLTKSEKESLDRLISNNKTEKLIEYNTKTLKEKYEER